MPVIRYLEVSVRRDFGKLDKFEKFERISVLNLDTIMRFTQNDLFRRCAGLLPHFLGSLSIVYCDDLKYWEEDLKSNVCTKATRLLSWFSSS